MRPSCLLIRCFHLPIHRYAQRRNLLTLAIETSCDDTSVAVLQRNRSDNVAFLHFHEKITSDNQSFGGVHPIVAHESHQKNLAALIDKALQTFPFHHVRNFKESEDARHGFFLPKDLDEKGLYRKKPDFITVTRGPGMRANLITGLDTAKGLAVAWQIPLLGVNHMQAHALTPRLVSAIHSTGAHLNGKYINTPAFPFLTLLVSGGHTMLVHSKGLCDHEILANMTDIAVGDMIDKTARDILPEDLLKKAGGVMYGPMLEKFAFPGAEEQYDYQQSWKGGAESRTWSITPPLQNRTPQETKSYNAMFSFSGIGSSVKRFMKNNPVMDNVERQLLARETMRVAFEHLASRVIVALKSSKLSSLKTVVVSGGVASNQYLRHLIRNSLDGNGHEEMELVFPPPVFCTDNAAMIAWAGMEMWDAGYRTELDAMVLKKWAIDPKAEDGGILGVDGWKRMRSGRGAHSEPIPLT
jgi:N6-L-threonylcarbamoyladenine synthase